MEESGVKMTLHNNGAGYFDKEVHVLCDEPLNIVVETDAVYNNLYAVCSLNKSRNVFRVKDGVLSIPVSFLSPGVLLVNLQQVEKGKVVKQWSAEQITLRSLKDGYEAIPELAMMRKAISELYALIKKNNQM